ncbi:MAG: acyl-CoA dehydrogenase [Gemmatimonadaceae bacterium]
MIPQLTSLTLLTAHQREIQQAARDFAMGEIAPHSAAWDRDAHFEPQLVRKLGELGFLGMLVPEPFDGLGLDTLTYLVALEEIAVVDASVAVMISVHNSLPAQMILRWGTDEQKERFLRPLARGEKLGAFALSEPDAGSDAAALITQAVRDGDCWVLNGTKAWVSSGTHADVIIAMARTDRPSNRRGARGISAFIVTPDMPGFRVGKKEDKMGLRASPTVQLVFENLRVPAANLLGQEGQGFRYAMQSLDNGRLGIAAQAVGIARAALEHSLAYAAERRQFGKPIADFEAIQFKLADMAKGVAASRALLHATAAAKDRGESVTLPAAMSKLLASETAMSATREAVQIFGGYGYITDYPVERLFRDAKVTEIYEGTSEIQRVVIARQLYAKSGARPMTPAGGVAAQLTGM